MARDLAHSSPLIPLGALVNSLLFIIGLIVTIAGDLVGVVLMAVSLTVALLAPLALRFPGGRVRAQIRDLLVTPITAVTRVSSKEVEKDETTVSVYYPTWGFDSKQEAVTRYYVLFEAPLTGRFEVSLSDFHALEKGDTVEVRFFPNSRSTALVRKLSSSRR